jgi:hypothetical protein
MDTDTKSILIGVAVAAGAAVLYVSTNKDAQAAAPAPAAHPPVVVPPAPPVQETIPIPIPGVPPVAVPSVATKPPYKPGPGSGWYLGNPQEVASGIPPTALSRPLNKNEIVVFYLTNDLPPSAATLVVVVTASVNGLYSEGPPAPAYDLTVLSAQVIRGTADMSKTQLPSAGTQTTQYRSHIVSTP